MSVIQFQFVDAFVKWVFKGFKGKFEDCFDENESRQAWRGLLYVILSVFIIILIFRLI